LSFHDASPDDLAVVEALPRSAPLGRCAVVVRRLDGRPVVIENEPHLRDGTPMPTLFWLVDPELHDAVSRLEGEGGVHRFEDARRRRATGTTHEEYAERRRRATVRHDGGAGPAAASAVRASA
jgi:uncharacterized protein